MFFYILFNIIVSERKFFNLSCTICMKICENIQHPIDIYDEIFILWHLIFLNLSIHWHLEFRYSTWIVCNVPVYYITHSFACSFMFFIIFEKNTFLTFFIPISHVRYIYEWMSYL